MIGYVDCLMIEGEQNVFGQVLVMYSVWCVGTAVWGSPSLRCATAVMILTPCPYDPITAVAPLYLPPRRVSLISWTKSNGNWTGCKACKTPPTAERMCPLTATRARPSVLQPI